MKRKGDVQIDRADIVRARLRRHWPAVEAGLARLYPDAGAGLSATLARRVADVVGARPDPLFARDLVREAEPDWFQQPDMVGYVAYVDRFAGSLRGMQDRLDYLDELGVSYVHLMPLLRARQGENDGGYAVASYDEVEPALGSVDDLARLASALHERDMSLCIDLVVNHTAAEHDWARRARAGDPHDRAFYLMYPDRTVPDRYEPTLLEVFPTFAPGNFTWLPDAERWVWTTFHEFQWDLDWSNPDVFVAMVEVMFRLADLGVDVLRLDAVPFLWKREGTVCQNLPEVHVLLRTLRAVMAVAAPATIFKAEAIVPPDELTRYVGAGDPPQHECELAYHNQLMVLLWSSLATGEARLMTNALQRVGAIPAHASWVTYVRCHDDIGWAITDEAAASVGWDGPSHRNFLVDFYAGRFPDSFARGEVFQFNPDTGDARISGTAASLCGIEKALSEHDPLALDLACRRLELVHAVICGFGGIPLLYMGDELGMVNDATYLDDAARVDDNRWLHRPAMDWDLAAQRADEGTLEHRIFTTFRSLLADRVGTAVLHGGASVEVHTAEHPEVFAFTRRHPVRGRFSMRANFGPRPVSVALPMACSVVRSSGAEASVGQVVLQPMGYVWVVEGPEEDGAS